MLMIVLILMLLFLYGNDYVMKRLMLMLRVMELLMWMLLSFCGKVTEMVIDNILDVCVGHFM